MTRKVSVENKIPAYAGMTRKVFCLRRNDRERTLIEE
jgi:hypothetical protein